jgi:competence ComEA-like helix-hairpin-helix protein
MTSAVPQRDLVAFVAVFGLLLLSRGAWEPRVEADALSSALSSGFLSPLYAGDRLDVNTADAESLAAIPGVGAATAARIVADRSVRGPFPSVGAIDRVSGVGASTLRTLAPYVRAEAASVEVARSSGDPAKTAPRSRRRASRSVDPNTASLHALEALPGVGPVTARAIVADRAANGPYASLQDLDRVKGIGPKTLERLQEYILLRDHP